MNPMLLLAAWLLAAAPEGEVKDRACFVKCSEQIQACQSKCPPLPESTDEGEDEGEEDPKKPKKDTTRQPTAPEACHNACLKKSEPCLKGCK